MALTAWPPAAIARPAPTAPVAAGATASGPPAPAGPAATDGDVLLPSIHYEDALAHAGDEIAFTPGERVSVGFTPRADDSWEVDGERPRALPSGQVSGAAMEKARQGSVWTVAPPSGQRDAGGPDDATGASIDTGMGPSLAATTVASTTATDPEAVASPGAVISPSALRREIFGFLPYWEVSDASTTLDWDVLSTVAYFSVGADKNGNLIKQDSDGSASTGWGGWTSSKMTSIISAAHQHGTRVVLTISCFAWTTGQETTQSTLLGSATARSNLAKQVAAAVRDRGADGVNLDFEPIVSGYAEEFTALVRSVRAELNAVAPGYQLTFDTTGYIGNYPLEAATAPGGADAIFIMGYDYRTSGSSSAGSISPLSGPVYDLTDTVSAYAARVSPSKLILGVPYYGRAWSTSTDALHAANISGTKYGTSVTAIYTTAVDLAREHGRRFDSVEQAPWTAYRKETCTTTYGCVTAWRQLYYDDAASLKLRYDLVNRAGLRGAGIWALGYDGTRPELYTALADKFLHDSTAPLVGVNAFSMKQRDLGFEVRWTGVDESSMASFDVQVAVDGGAWTDWRLAVAGTSAIYLGADGHAYAFRARGRDFHGNLSPWLVTSTSTAATLAAGGFGTVQVDGLKLRAGATTAATILDTLNTGDAVAITAGPATADGYTWYQVTGPVRQWSPVNAVTVGGWVAVGSASEMYVAPRIPINATIVDPVLAGYGLGTNGSRTITPNGDGVTDTFAVRWTSGVALETLVLNVLREDGTLLGSLPVAATTAGPHSIAWDGNAGGAIVPDGRYLLQLVGTKGAATYSAPSAKPASPEQLAAFGVKVDHLPVSRLGGADRYATAAAVSAATFGPGVPVAYIATGQNFPDALAGAAAAGHKGGPLLLTTRDGLPAATAAELARLKPAKIVVLGSSAVVSTAVATALKSYTAGTVSRLGGADRYATAALISAATFAPGVPVAYLATGQNFPDALAGAAAAGHKGGPLLLVTKDALPAAIKAELARLKPAKIVILGSGAVVSAAVATAADAYTTGSVSRLGGTDRYATAAAVSAATFGPGVPVAYIATGQNFPDALAGAAAAGFKGGPLLLVTTDALPAVVAAELARLEPARIVVLGATSVVSGAVALAAETAAGG
jgi:spore germination protein YaaH/putative cell wall-binding protein